MKDIQAGLARKAAARERRTLEIEAALASARKMVPAAMPIPSTSAGTESPLKSQTSSASRNTQQNTTPTLRAVIPDGQTTPATNANVAAIQDLEPTTQSAKKNVPFQTSSLPSVYTQEELTSLASFVDSDDLDGSDTESNGSGREKASQKSTSSSLYTPEELSALADLLDEDWDDIDSDRPAPPENSKYTEEELAEMAACLDDSSDFDLDD
ncbi:hypothetical protein CPB85DRAFT_992877 [Mucidula mucida]|nr:hypothetical protein CPB85DRAFT_992877 [Mucidula mucida]